MRGVERVQLHIAGDAARCSRCRRPQRPCLQIDLGIDQSAGETVDGGADAAARDTRCAACGPCAGTARPDWRVTRIRCTIAHRARLQDRFQNLFGSVHAAAGMGHGDGLRASRPRHARLRAPSGRDSVRAPRRPCTLPASSRMCCSGKGQAEISRNLPTLACPCARAISIARCATRDVMP